MKLHLHLLIALSAGLASGAALADARADIMAAYEAAMAKKSYRVVSTTEVRGKPYQTTIDVMMPASFHMRGPDTEAIILPAGTWMKAGGQWMQIPMDMSKMIQGLTVDAMKKGADALADVTEEGSETVNGCDSTNYRYTASGEAMGIKSTAKVLLSICGETGLPIRVISEDLKGKSRTVLDYDYDATISIRPPN